MATEEVIDVEEYHNNMQRRSDEKWQGRYHKLKDEMRDLETKTNKISHANDDLRRQIFAQTQQQRRVASLLGFDNFDSIEASVTEKDPWIRGGSNRILLLETYVAELLESAKDAQAARTQMEDLLMDAQDDARRLRQERESARREAERQAGDARAWRDELQTCREELQKSREEVQFWTNEVNTRLPEMQALIQAQQAKNIVQPEHPCGVEKEKVSPQFSDHDPSILRNVVNTPTSPIGGCAMPSDRSKKAYELLQAKYDDLFASKEKISKRYFEDLKKWKEFKQWLVRDDAQNKNNKRRALRRLKAMENIGLQDDPDVLLDGDVSIIGKNGPADDPDVTLLGPNDEPQKIVEVDLNKHDLPPVQKPNVNVPSSLTLRISPPSPAPLEESLTQSSSIPLPRQDRSLSAPRLPSIDRLSEQLPLSQESVTQASSNPPSPIREPSQFQTNLEDNPSESLYKVPVMKTEPEENPLFFYTDPGPSKQQGGANIRSISQQNADLITDGRTKNFSDIPQCRNSLSPELASVPPPVLQSDFKMTGIRRTSTVLAADTPPRASALVRHHSSPPDSPHVPESSPGVVRRGKRKAVDMEDADNTDHENISDPFAEGSSRSRGKPDIFQKHGQRAAHGKVLGKQSHKEYMAQYMPYKGRGRYSNTASNPTVNAEYEIDPSRNGGVNYQFDAVVRDKAARKNLEAGDCECCREYYEAVGPLPPRLKPPMWRSPSLSREDRPFRPCRRHKDGGRSDVHSTPSPNTRTKEIESHKHEISRHRHDWAPTTTPPRYWNIGFPNTQEVEDINRQADDMHARKFQRVRAEANSKNGRYRRRE